MAYSFGSVQQLPKQHYVFGEQKSVREARRENSLVGFWRVFIVIAELGLSLIPGVGTAAQVGIGLAAATANTALSAATGSLTGVGVGIDFAAAIIPGAVAMKTASKIKGVINSKNVLAAERAAISTVGEVSEKSAFRGLQKGLANARKNAMAATKLEKQAVQKSKELATRISKGELTNQELAAIEIADLSQAAAGQARIFETKTNEVLRKYNVSMKEVKETIRDLEKTFEAVKNLKFSQMASKSDFIRALDKISTTDLQKSLLRDIYVEPLMRNKGAVKTARDITHASILRNSLRDELSEDGQQMFDLFINRLKYQKNIGKKDLETIFEDMEIAFKHISLNDARVFSSMIKEDAIKESFYVFMNAGRGERSAWRKWIKFAGSRKFNDKVVQVAQLIDPNDSGRYLVERAYQSAKYKIDNYFQKKAFKKAYKQAVKGVRSTKYDLDKAFKNAGGVLIGKGNKNAMIGSRYILGIKKIGWTVGKGPVLVKFNKANTSSKVGKNVGGKKDIIVSMTDLDFKRLEIEGTKYWFAVGKKKGWFVSRGGKRARGNLGTVANNMSLFLGFVPIPALRNLLSIVSNWVENIADIARHDYFKQWIPKFERAFVRSSINRTGRLLTRAVAGGAFTAYRVKNGLKAETQKLLDAGKKLGTQEFDTALKIAATQTSRASAWVGRELQRASTTILSTFEGTDSKGYFKFVNGSTTTRSTAANLGHKIFTAALPTSLRGSLTRKGTRIGRTKGRELVGAKRNLGQIARISSAVVPTGVPTIRQITRFK